MISRHLSRHILGCNAGRNSFPITKRHGKPGLRYLTTLHRQGSRHPIPSVFHHGLSSTYPFVRPSAFLSPPILHRLNIESTVRNQSQDIKAGTGNQKWQELDKVLFSERDLLQFRRDTPGLRVENEGMKPLVHFNHAGCSLPPQCVLDAIYAYMKEEALLGGYEVERKNEKQINGVYQSVAKLLACQSHEIAFVENATVAWQLAFHSLSFQPGDIILTSHTEYASNYIAFLHAKQKHQVKIQVIPHTDQGSLDLHALSQMMSNQVRLVAVSHIPTNGGLVQPANEIGQICRKYPRAIYILDGCQTVGQIPVDVKAIDCDVFTATGRKYLRGPRGTGFLYLSEKMLENDLKNPIFLDMRGAVWGPTIESYQVCPSAQRYENWEFNYALRLGLGAAVDYFLQVGPAAAWQRIQKVAQSLREALDTLPGVQVCDLASNPEQSLEPQCGLVTFVIESFPKEEDMRRCAEILHTNHRINVSVSAATSTLIDMHERGFPAVIRASVHYMNTQEEIDHFVSVLRDLIKTSSSLSI